MKLEPVRSTEYVDEYALFDPAQAESVIRIMRAKGKSREQLVEYANWFTATLPGAERPLLVRLSGDGVNAAPVETYERLMLLTGVHADAIRALLTEKDSNAYLSIVRQGRLEAYANHRDLAQEPGSPSIASFVAAIRRALADIA
jgi:hypothetical protein